MRTRILYIEDNVLNMRLVGRVLKSLGYEMLEAMDGQTGLRVVEDEMPDLILADINLPDINGLVVTSRIKANPDTGHIPVIALTANALYGDRERCIDAGCDDYLAKPVSRMELKNMLERYIIKERQPATA